MKTYDELCSDYNRKSALAEVAISEYWIAMRKMNEANKACTDARNALLAFRRSAKSKPVECSEVMA